MINNKRKTILKTDKFVETEIDNERVLMQIDNGYFFVFNTQSEAIWSAIDHKRTLDEIIEEMSTKFEGSKDRISSDVIEFIDTLVEKDLVTLS